MPVPNRRFPPPWLVEDYDTKCFIVRDADGQQLAYVYYKSEPGRRSAAKLFTRDKARRFAANITKLPELLKRQAKSRTVDMLLGAGGEMGGFHHVAWQAKFEAKRSDESRNGIGRRGGGVAGGRRGRGRRWVARR